MPFDLRQWLPEFPIREHCLFLDHAAVCPLPRPVAEAMRRRIADQERTGYDAYKEWRNNHLACRHLGSQLIGCSPEDITIVRSTSEGLSLIAEGLVWKKGEQVLVGEEEFAANVAPWLHLARKGVKVVRYPQPDGRIDPDQIARLMTAKTRLVAVSWVAVHTGWIAPLAQIGGLCRDRGCRLVVDAIQGLGVLPLDMAQIGADAVVADGHKWLLGPEGAGLMATTPELRSQLHPVLSGWRNVRLEPGDFFLDRLTYLEDGRRFEPGAGNGGLLSRLGPADRGDRGRPSAGDHLAGGPAPSRRAAGRVRGPAGVGAVLAALLHHPRRARGARPDPREGEPVARPPNQPVERWAHREFREVEVDGVRGDSCRPARS